MTMPTMDGRASLKALHDTHHRAASLPVVVVSAGVIERGLGGVTGFVKKPVAPDVLVALVRAYCGTPWGYCGSS
jgi:hypothetical protein